MNMKTLSISSLYSKRSENGMIGWLFVPKINKILLFY